MCSATWLCTKIVHTSGSSPPGDSIVASRARSELLGILRRQRVQVDDAVVRVCSCWSAAQCGRAEVVAEFRRSAGCPRTHESRAAMLLARHRAPEEG